MTELIPDPEFNDPNKWQIVGFGGQVTGGQLVFTLANVIRAAPIPDVLPTIGSKYTYQIDVATVSPFGFTGRALFGGVEFWNKTQGAGLFEGEITAIAETGLVFQALPATYSVNKVSIMTATLVNDILDYLHGQGILDGVTSWVGKANYLPPQPDQTIVITETPGLPPDGSPGVKYDQPSFQVRVRGASDGMQDAQTKIFEIFDALNDVSIPGYCFIFGSTSAPLFIGLDTNNRPEFVWNFDTMKQR